MNGCTVIDETQWHNHNCNIQIALLYEKVSNMLKQKSVDCLSDKYSKIIWRALMDDSTILVSESDLEQFRKNMYEACSVCPPLPKSQFEEPLPLCLPLIEDQIHTPLQWPVKKEKQHFYHCGIHLTSRLFST